MMHHICKTLSIGIIILLLAACQPAEPLPTLVPAAQLPPTSMPTETPLPPTYDFRDLNPTAPPQLDAPEDDVTPTPTPIKAAISITAPEPGLPLVMGDELVVRGLAQRGEGYTVWITFLNKAGRIIGENEVPLVDGEMFWEAVVIIPQRLTGPAVLQATIRDAEGEAVVIQEREIELVVESGITTGSYILLEDPLPGGRGVANHYFYLQGFVRQPAGERLLKISLWGNDCETRLSRQSFMVDGSGRWWGFLPVPRSYAGAACLLAEIGESESRNWRGSMIEVEITAYDDPDAKGIVVGWPRAQHELQAGAELNIYGVAYNSPDGELWISVLMENGRVVADKRIPIDTLGYWETSVNIPPDVNGQAFINLTTGEFDDTYYSQAQIPIVVEE